MVSQHQAVVEANFLPSPRAPAAPLGKALRHGRLVTGTGSRVRQALPPGDRAAFVSRCAGGVRGVAETNFPSPLAHHDLGQESSSPSFRSPSPPAGDDPAPRKRTGLWTHRRIGPGSRFAKVGQNAQAPLPSDSRYVRLILSRHEASSNSRRSHATIARLCPPVSGPGPLASR
jgi:hypothetical protein